MTKIATPTWLVQLHSLASLAATSGDVSFRSDLVRATLDWARIERDLPPIIRQLAAVGVRVAPIKGVAYAKALYALPAERPMSDVDLLVAPGTETNARIVFQELGFARVTSPIMHHAEAWIRGDLVIDLHWNIIAPGRSRIDLEGLWSRTVAGWPDGAEQLEAVDALVFHLVHFARNRLLVPLINVVDMARLLERLPDRSAQPALDRAKRWGLGEAARVAHRFYTSIIESRVGRPAGWVGPAREEVALLGKPSAARKVLFDLATAGSAAQFASRALAYGANQLRALKRS